MNKEKIFYLIPGIFAVVGTIFLVSGIVWMVFSVQFKKNSEQIVGEITHIEWRGSNKTHNVYVGYEYGGKTYNARLNSYSSSMYEGKEINLLCDTEHPERVQAASMIYLGPILFCLMGGMFALIGCIILFLMIRSHLQRKKLLENGRSIYATVEEITINRSVRVNGSNPYVIICTYKDDYKDIIYRFKSEGIWSDPSYLFPVGSTIEVKVDENDYSRYYVNTSEIRRRVIDYT